MTPFQRIYDRVSKEAPALCMKSFHPIHEWIAQGYDIEKDIMPAIDDSLKYGGKSIYSWNFFTSSIKKRHEQRLKVPVEVKQVTDEQRAKSIKWVRSRNICTTGITDADYRWLDQYELKNGEVQI